MRRGNASADELGGQDSFLDVVANMVGILILLVMVVGVRASYQPPSTDTARLEKAAADVDPAEIKLAYDKALSRQHDLQQLLRRVVNVDHSAALRDAERVELVTLNRALEDELEERRQLLGEEEQRDYDLRRQLSEAQRQIDQLTREQVALLSEAPEVEKLENLPTPIAETVQGNEIHLRLSGGRVAFIPLDDLLDEFRADAEANLWQLRDRDVAVNTVGPLRGFRLRYMLRKSGYTRSGRAGSIQQGTLVQLVRWELMPTSNNLGEPVEEAIRSDSDLLLALRSHRPEATTVTVWTYPDSFSDFRQLKEFLFQRGYPTAARPLPDGVPVGGSPRGTKSVAQ